MTTNYDDWAGIYDPIHNSRTADIPFYVNLAREAGSPVLEVTCGTGRVTVPVARAGVDITGLDISPAMLRIARRKLRAAGPLPGQVTFKRGDARSFRLDQQFNLAFIPFNSFLLFLSVADQRQALERIRRHLKPGGRLALDIFVPDLYRLTREDNALYHGGDITDPVSGRRFVLWERATFDNHHQIIHSRPMFEELDQNGRGIQRLYRNLELRYIYRYEMQHLLELSGFQIEELYGDFDGGDFDAASETMVWVAKKA